MIITLYQIVLNMSHSYSNYLRDRKVETLANEDLDITDYCAARDKPESCLLKLGRIQHWDMDLLKKFVFSQNFGKNKREFEAYESLNRMKIFWKMAVIFWFMIEFFVSLYAIWMLFEIDL